MKIRLNFKVLLFSLLLIMFATGNVFASGNSITFLAAENVTGSWDPSSHTNNAQERVDKWIGDTLLTVDADNNLMPKLATSWENIDDYTWELKLRKGVKFHNGKEMTAHDVKATIEYYTRPEELDAQVFGFDHLAKITNKSFEEVMKNWFKTHQEIHLMNNEEVQKVMKKLIDYKFYQGRYKKD